MKIYLIRHGRTDWNDTNKIQGKSDIPLNPTGILQAEKLASELKNEKYDISHVYTSHLQRARKTAEIISSELNIPCDILNGVEEINLGDWEGLSWDEVMLHYPEAYKIWRKNRRYTKSVNGESYDDMLQRVLSALLYLSKTSNKNIAVVTHSAVIMALMCYINNAPFEKMTDYKVKNTSVTTIDSHLLKKTFDKI